MTKNSKKQIKKDKTKMATCGIVFMNSEKMSHIEDIFIGGTDIGKQKRLYHL